MDLPLLLIYSLLACHQAAGGVLKSASYVTPTRKPKFVGNETKPMKKAREMEFRVQCRKHKGAPVLGEGQAIAEIAFRAIEGTTAESCTGAEEEIFAMGRAGFCAAARGPIKSWWYQSGDKSGIGVENLNVSFWQSNKRKQKNASARRQLIACHCHCLNPPLRQHRGSFVD